MEDKTNIIAKRYKKTLMGILITATLADAANIFIGSGERISSYLPNKLYEGFYEGFFKGGPAGVLAIEYMQEKVTKIKDPLIWDQRLY